MNKKEKASVPAQLYNPVPETIHADELTNDLIKRFKNLRFELLSHFSSYLNKNNLVIHDLQDFAASVEFTREALAAFDKRLGALERRVDALSLPPLPASPQPAGGLSIMLSKPPTVPAKIQPRHILSMIGTMAYLGLAKSTIYQLAEGGGLPVIRKPNGHLYFNVADLDEWQSHQGEPRGYYNRLRRSS
jgi:predicted DNA-binding transcriptional regulator AlpA